MNVNQLNKSKERERWIDVAKAVGIILVLWAHALSKEDYVWGYINQFHMPLFFSISGYLYSCKGAWKDYLKKKIKGLYVPQILCSLLMLLVFVLIGVNDFSLKTVILILLLLESGPLLGATWFIRVLFFAIVAYDLLWRVSKRLFVSERTFKIILTVITICIFGIGLMTRFPFKISNILVAIGFIHMGQLIRWYKEKIFNISPVIAVIMLLIIGIINIYNDTSVSTNTYTSVWLFIIASILGIIGVTHLCKKYGERENAVLKHLRFIGQNTIGIVVWQFIAFKIVMIIQIIVYDELSWVNINDYPIIYEYNNAFWVMLLILSGIYLSIGLHKGLSCLGNFLTQKIHQLRRR